MPRNRDSGLIGRRVNRRRNQRRRNRANDNGQLDSLQYIARLTGEEGEVASVRYFAGEGEEGESAEQRLIVAVRGLEADSTYAVTVDGVEIGEIVTNANGRGRLILSSDPDQESEAGFPESFPDLTSGSNIQIGETLGGELSEFSRPSQPTFEVTEALQANVSAESDLLGKVTYVSVTSTIDEVTSTSEFIQVRLRGGEAGETVQLSIDGVEIAELTYNDRGVARALISSDPRNDRQLQLPESTPDLSADSILSIGDSATVGFDELTTPSSDQLLASRPFQLGRGSLGFLSRELNLGTLAGG